MNQEIISQKIFDRIKSAKKPLFVIHKKPDGDALGSALALVHWLESEGKPARVFCRDFPPVHYEFLPRFNRIITEEKVFQDPELDLVIVLDSGDLFYAGVQDILTRTERIFSIINIDHHATNQHYGEINLVDSSASSTAEMIFNFLKYNRQPIDKHMATALLAGILTDTTNFTNPGTTVGSMRVASQLIAHGARTNEISRHLLKNKSIDALRLWGKTLTRLEENKKLNMAIAVIKREDLEGIEAENEAIEGVANFLNSLLVVELVLVLRETEDGFVKGSLRSTNVDVSRIAKALGGGGHKKAAGFTIKGRLEQVDGKWEVV